jgi:hypothetical protein
VELVFLDCGRSRTQLIRDSLGARPLFGESSMRTPFIALLSVAILPAVCGAQGRAGARWTPLLVTVGETVDIDFAAVERTNGTVLTWLRWDLDRNGPELTGEYRVERVELDCAHARIRVLGAWLVPRPGARMAATPTVLPPSDTTRKATALVLTPSDTTWHTYSGGSLGAQAVREACRGLTTA